MTPEARAEVYAPIFENVLKTRCDADVSTSFQFQEIAGDGIAHAARHPPLRASQPLARRCARRGSS
jgi:hypothetical protein